MSLRSVGVSSGPKSLDQLLHALDHDGWWSVFQSLRARQTARFTGRVLAVRAAARWPRSDRDEPRPLECFGCPTPERVRGLAGIAAGDVGRGMAEVSAHLFEGHPVVDQEGRSGMADPVRAERAQTPTTVSYTHLKMPTNR